ncbi:InlB B-repeat-containing protein [Botryobacter ruber]|uniref:InlB B-repeat-containing protein n=1 Tax=Botryobacter ruber TaxID=2171629 RepID=UPI000E0B1680|nr:metallophosphoesterase [Botryobacter ruber]
MLRLSLLLCSFVALLSLKSAAQTSMVPFGSSWKYLDDGSNQGTAWRSASFSDGSWESGNGAFGYGDSGLSTTIDYGPNFNKKYITTYFRKSFSIPDATMYAGYTARVRRDDGIVLYVNGVEVLRNNMPSGTITYTTEAASSSEETISFPLQAAAFRSGTNVIAVEVHQADGKDADLSFDLELTGQYSLVVNTSGSGTVTRSPSQTTYASGSTVTLTARPDPDFVFTGWSGAASGTANPLTVTMSGNKVITAGFVPVERKVTGFVLVDADSEQDIQPIADGAVISLASLPSSKLNIRTTTTQASVDNMVFELSGTQRKNYTDNAAPFALHGDNGDGNFYYGNWNPPETGTYTLKATPYSGSGTPGTSLSITFTVVEDASAPPPAEQYSLALSTSGSGTVTRSPDQTTYDSGSTVSLTATPASGYAFAGWSGDASGTTNPLSVTMNSNKSITATFTAVSPSVYTLSVSTTGGGTVTKSPDQTTYASGSTVTLTATPATGFSFDGWSGDATGTTNPLAVTMTGNKAITATFTAVSGEQQLTGFVLVDSDSEQDIRPITDGAVISLASLPSTKLNIRTVSSTSSIGSTKLELQGPQSKVHTDNAAPFALHGDNGDGNYYYGNWNPPATGTYTLRATPYSGSDGTGTPGTPLTVSFSFVTDDDVTPPPAEAYSLAVSTSGSGTLSKSPDQTTYAGGSTVTLTATPATGFSFDGWSGDASGASNPLALTMNSNKSVTANFVSVSGAQQVTSFVFVDSGTEQDMQTITNGAVISLTASKVNIRANTSPASVGSVIFELSGAQSKTYTDNASPYALHGDNGSGNYYYGNWNPPAPGTYTLKATPYSGSNGSGTAGIPLTVSFTISSIRLTRGPYLQMGNQTAMTLRWRTSEPTDSRIEVGTTFGTYSFSATNPTVTTEHEVRISGLSPGTRYYYRFGSSSQILQADQSNFFNTAPSANTTRKIRIAAFGDCGADDNGNRTGSLSSYLKHTGGSPAELMLLLGDNAYADGTDADYQKEFFTPFGNNLLKNHVLFPAPGNHDYHNIALTERNAGGYYKSFSMPTAGECGGVPSGSKAFYSFDWGNIHFISLDSYGVEALDNTLLYDTTGVQVQWLKQDLAANTKQWVIAYWHHPPYSMGTHNSDTEADLVQIRQKVVRILERYGVDLVLTAHSHNYERSYLMDQYYDNEASFDLATHTKSSSSGKYNGSANSCVYVTASGSRNHGTVYVVEGSSGNSGEVEAGFPHKAMPFAVDDGGMLYLEVEDNRLDCKMLRKDGTIFDQFTIMQDVNKTTTIDTTPGSQVQLTASWVGTYRWSTGETTRSITVSPSASTVYSVSDAYNCLTDVFNVNTEPVAAATQSLTGTNDGVVQNTGKLEIYPTIVRRGARITIRTNEKEAVEAFVTDITGRVIQTHKFSGSFSIQTKDLPAGMYFISLDGSKYLPEHKFVVTD